MSSTNYKKTMIFSGGKAKVDQQKAKQNSLPMIEFLMHNSAMLKLTKETSLGRRAVLSLGHGKVETPFFMPVATSGAMKGITLADLHELGAEILLSNTYHLHLSPGEETVQVLGGLHDFIGWKKPMLTDSGGFQVFSLKAIRKITDEGVLFRDHRSGKEHFIGPVEAMDIQHALGADIIMCFDECPPSNAPRAEQLRAVERTLTWAKACKKRHTELLRKKSTENFPLLFGIVQGGLERDLRQKCTEELISMEFDGYAIGGLAVGESEQEMYSIVSLVCPLLPREKPRYLMGVGERHQLKEAVRLGIDMFDCVSPMREGRHGNIWLSDGTKLRIRREEYARDGSPIDIHSPAFVGRHHSKAYLRHLLKIGERYGETIACLQNMAVVLEDMRKIRQAIESAPIASS